METNIAQTSSIAIAPFILGIHGKRLDMEEKELFTHLNPLGFIIFRRNIENEDQLKKLIFDLKNCLGRPDDLPPLILIDCEGGPVNRLKTLGAQYDYPSAQYYANLASSDLPEAKKQLITNTLKMAEDLRSLGFNTNCAPVLDLVSEGTPSFLIERSFGSSVETIVELSSTMASNLKEKGIIPVIKHIPGHGRASDSHYNIAKVTASLKTLESTDFKVYRDFMGTKLKTIGMVAHVIYDCLDKENPATQSRAVISYIKNHLFSGLLISDAIEMKALAPSGNIKQRAEKILNTGIDIILHCSGVLKEMQELADLQKEKQLFLSSEQRNKIAEIYKTNIATISSHNSANINTELTGSSVINSISYTEYEEFRNSV